MSKRTMDYGDAAWGASNGFSPEPREAVAASTPPTEATDGATLESAKWKPPSTPTLRVGLVPDTDAGEAPGTFVSPYRNREAVVAIDKLVASLHLAGSSRLRLETVLADIRRELDGAR